MKRKSGDVAGAPGILDRRSRRGSTSSIHGVVPPAPLVHPCTSQDALERSLSMNHSMVVCCADACALDRGGSFLRPAAGESLLIGFAQTTKNALRRVARLPHRRHRYASCSTMSARSEEHTSELQSLMRISYAAFCLKKK